MFHASSAVRSLLTLGFVADGFGDAASVRALGQALLAAGRGLSAVTEELSGTVHGLIPSGWSGGSADAFGSDWSAKAQQAGQLAAACTHVGQVLTSLAGELEAANQQAARAQQMTGGPASRFALPSTEQQSQQMLSRASGAAQRARAAARAKLAGIAVPRIGSPLTVSDVSAWAERLAPPPEPSQPWYDSLWHGAEHVAGDIGSAGSGALNDLGQAAAGFFGDGVMGTLKGLGDLAGMGPLYGDPSFTQTWGGMGHLVEPWHWNTFAQSWETLGKGLLAWDEWQSDPARASGQVLFNLVTPPFVATKLLDAGDAAAAAARAAKAGEAADGAGDASRLGTAGKTAGAAKAEPNLPGLSKSHAQLEAKFKHASDFGVTGPRGSSSFDAYGKALDEFVRDPKTTRIRGTYRGKPAILNYNQANRLVVVQAPDGSYVSGWQMSKAQLQNVISRRSLGGG